MSDAPQGIPRWGMVVDLNRCVGCQTCTIACKHANDTPPGVQWRRVLDVEQGTFPNVQREFLVTGCQHCAEPPCVPVCPTGATRQRLDGMVTMDYDLCIGCAYCAVACPYQARTIVHDREWFYGRETVQEQAVAHEERVGVAQKCTFCAERVDEGLEAGRVPGLDLDYTPACSASCIASAIHFGDFNDPASNVSRLVEENASFQMHAQLGTDPQIKYLYETPAVPGRKSTEGEGVEDEELLADPANPLVGERQTFWDFRAAMNFILGGMGSGLAFLVVLLYFAERLAQPLLLDLIAGAGVLMATGLFFVFMEIGRKRRFLYVLLRPQSSWMTRETYCVAIFYPALLLDLWRPQPWLHAVVAAAALGFLISQARILYAGRGIPAWRTPLVPWLIFTSGLLEGAGLLALAQLYYAGSPYLQGNVAAVAALLAIVNGILWMVYRLTARQKGIPPLARRQINRVSPFITVIGHALPVIAFTLLAQPAAAGYSVTSLLLVAGVGAVLGGVAWKSTVITRAAFQQGFAMPWLPQRGSGTRAAPYRDGFRSEG
jgi:phenylacetyl-CoA:acceptor oxidoreductase subunit 1